MRTRHITIIILAGIAGLAVSLAIEGPMRRHHPVCAELVRLRDTPETYARYRAASEEQKVWCRVPDIRRPAP